MTRSRERAGLARVGVTRAVFDGAVLPSPGTRRAMPVRWNIDPNLGLTTVTAEGRLDLQAALDTMTELYAQPSYRPPMLDLWDLRAAELDSAPGDVQAFVRFLEGSRGENGTAKTALVVGRTADFGLSRQYQAYAEMSLPLSINVFTSLDEARAWLGV